MKNDDIEDDSAAEEHNNVDFTYCHVAVIIIFISVINAILYFISV